MIPEVQPSDPKLTRFWPVKGVSSIYSRGKVAAGEIRIMPRDRQRSLLACRLGAASLFALVIGVFWSGCSAARAAGAGDEGQTSTRAEADPAAVEFFEKNVRPILASRCQGCHGPEKQRAACGSMRGRRSWPAGDRPGGRARQPRESLLVDAINYGETYQMPPKSKLPPEEIATLTDWVEAGSSLGHRSRQRAENLVRRARAPGSRASLEGRIPGPGRYWSFQPLARSPSRGEVDKARWVATTRSTASSWPPLEAQGLTPGARGRQADLDPPAHLRPDRAPPDARARSRHFWPTGRPPPTRRLVDRLLACPTTASAGRGTGSTWSRYAETSGHEFDYDIPNAFRYRDYVIRALNVDLPYDQFVVEQVAGDLLEDPARHPAEGFNESILGTGFYFLGEGTHSPVDLRDEEMRRIDNQIDVLSKTFLGLTRRLRPLPRPQVRPDHHRRLLRPGGLPAQLAASARLHRCPRADRRLGRRLARARRRAYGHSEAKPRQLRNRSGGRSTASTRAGSAPGRQSRRAACAETPRAESVFEDFNRADYRRLVRHGRRVRRSAQPAGRLG